MCFASEKRGDRMIDGVERLDGSHCGRKRRKENATHTIPGGKLCRGTKTKSTGEYADRENESDDTQRRGVEMGVVYRDIPFLD